MKTAPDIVLLHGALGAREQFSSLAASLAETFRVHTLDFEGHGAAPSRGRPFRIQHFAENVAELLDAIDVVRADIFGYSMGGYVALHFAMTYPQRVGRIATLGTKFWWDRPTAAREAGRLNPEVIRAKVPRFAAALESRHVGAGGWERVLAYTAECLRELGERPLMTETSLAGVTQSVRVIVGDRDSTVSVEESAVASRAIPGGELAVLPRTPHPIEQVELGTLMPTLVDFFQGSPVAVSR